MRRRHQYDMYAEILFDNIYSTEDLKSNFVVSSVFSVTKLSTKTSGEGHISKSFLDHRARYNEFSYMHLGLLLGSC